VTQEEIQIVCEAICAFQGHIYFRIYMKGKAKIWHKLFELCEAKSGIVCIMEVYAGQHPTEPDHISFFPVVHRLCEPIENKDCTVHMDQCFASPTLLDHL
jgi:hypothetical protein